MTPRSLMILSLLSIAACAEAPAGNAGSGVDGSTGANQVATAGRGLVGQAGFDTATGCYARTQAVQAIYLALAEHPRDAADAAELSRLAGSRERASAVFRDAARRIGTELGRSETQVNAALMAAEREVEAERGRREFRDFADWVAGESDHCPEQDAALTVLRGDDQ
jgi:hypothetical protein